MAVPAYERKESKMEFLNNMRNLRKSVLQLLERDFGIKKRSYDIKLIEKIYEIDENDKVKFEKLSEKYGMQSYIVEKYPEWLISDIRHEIRATMHEICKYIELANSIYIINEEAYSTRRSYWDKAIGYCNVLKDSINEILENFNIKLSFLEEIYEQIDKEIALIKGVRQYDSKFLKKIRNKNENKNNNEHQEENNKNNIKYKPKFE